MLQSIFHFIKSIVPKKKFVEYGYTIKEFQIDSIGLIKYAQWNHPAESPKSISQSNINFYKQLAGEGNMIIDIGAHTGDTTIPMALAVGKSGLVLGLEPNRYVFKILEVNAALNPSFTNIVPLCFAATQEDGNFEFHYSDASFCNGGYLSQIHSKNHHHHYTLQVIGKNLEKYLNQYYPEQLNKLTLLKVDAEGYDKEILKSLPNILRQYKPKLMVECYKKLDEQERYELFDVLTSYGYQVYHLDNFEAEGSRMALQKSDMTKWKHFEMLAIHQNNP